MAIEQITPSEAHQRQLQDPQTAFVDVRTAEEFAAGHPQGAINIPVLVTDLSSGQMNPNQYFGKVLLASVPTDKHVIMSCKSGGRSQSAAELAAQWGYTRLANMQGGFSGNPATGVAGWAAAGLPVSQDLGEGVSYESLKAKA